MGRRFGSEKLYFRRMSRDQHKVDVCLANAATGEVKNRDRGAPQHLHRNQTRCAWSTTAQELLWWSERDGWGHYYLYGADGTLKNQVTSGEFVTEDIESIDDKTRTMTFTAEGREAGENPVLHASLQREARWQRIEAAGPGQFARTRWRLPTTESISSTTRQPSIPRRTRFCTITRGAIDTGSGNHRHFRA